MTVPTPDQTDARLQEAVAALTLEEKVGLLTGRDFWNTKPIERIGLRRILGTAAVDLPLSTTIELAMNR